MRVLWACFLKFNFSYSGIVCICLQSFFGSIKYIGVNNSKLLAINIFFQKSNSVGKVTTGLVLYKWPF